PSQIECVSWDVVSPWMASVSVIPRYDIYWPSSLTLSRSIVSSYDVPPCQTATVRPFTTSSGSRKHSRLWSLSTDLKRKTWPKSRERLERDGNRASSMVGRPVFAHG